jgi:hypothetical protein
VIEILAKENYLQMPWANGLGLTEQIDIFPKNATVSQRNFQWRLSSAIVPQANPFSRFENYQRLLTVIDGAGLLINQRPLLPGETFTFSGSLEIQAALIEGPVRDLGLIFDPRLLTATMVTHAWPASRGDVTLAFSDTPDDVVYFFLVSGSIRVLQKSVPSGSCVRIEAVQALTFQIEQGPVRAVVLNLRRKKI